MSAPGSPSKYPVGKADLLARLVGKLRGAKIPAGVAIGRRRWLTEPAAAHADVLQVCGHGPLAVRSSACAEDSDPANAGRFLSLLGIDGCDFAGFSLAVRRVFDSYGDAHREDQVLVQREVTGVRHAIVAASRGTRGCCYHSTSLAASADATAITRGDTAAECWYFASDRASRSVPPVHAAVLRLVVELRRVLLLSEFELELIDDGEVLWLLQVRPMPATHHLWVKCAGATRRATGRRRRAAAAGSGTWD